MSQEKVDKYKEYKVNKQKIIKKEKIIRRLEYTGAFVILTALVVWFGISVYTKAKDAAPKKEYVMDISGIDEYVNSIASVEE